MGQKRVGRSTNTNLGMMGNEIKVNQTKQDRVFAQSDNDNVWEGENDDLIHIPPPEVYRAGWGGGR